MNHGYQNHSIPLLSGLYFGNITNAYKAINPSIIEKHKQKYTNFLQHALIRGVKSIYFSACS